MAKHKVTLNAHGQYGFAEYDDETKEIVVSIKGAKEDVKAVEEYLASPQTMDMPGPKGLREFTTMTFNAKDSVEDFKTVLSRLWVNTKVLVEWSMPPDSMEKL